MREQPYDSPAPRGAGETGIDTSVIDESAMGRQQRAQQMKQPVQLVRQPNKVGIERFVDNEFEHKMQQVSQEFQQLYAERMGANRDLGGDDDDEDPDDNGYGAGKKEWYETRFYKDMTEFYRAPGRQRMQTKPTGKLGNSISKMGSQLGGASMMLPNLQESINSRADSNMSPLGSPLRSPGKSPKRGGRLGRTSTEGEVSHHQVEQQHTLANTDYGLAKIEEDVESHTGGGIATYSVKKKTTTRTTSFVDHNGQVQTQVQV